MYLGYRADCEWNFKLRKAKYVVLREAYHITVILGLLHYVFTVSRV